MRASDWIVDPKRTVSNAIVVFWDGSVLPNVPNGQVIVKSCSLDNTAHDTINIPETIAAYRAKEGV